MSKRLEPEPIPRRDFLGLAGLWTAGIAVVGSIFGMGMLTKPRVLPESGTRFRIGPADQFPVGTVTILAEYKTQILSDDRGIAAVSLVCTHLGCIVKPTDEGYACPCHGSKFGKKGEVTRGPAPSPLRWFEVSMAANGGLLVDAKSEVPAETYYKV